MLAGTLARQNGAKVLTNLHKGVNDIMSISPNEIYQQLADAVVDMDEEQAVAHAHRVVEQDYNPYAAIEQGLSKGMERAGELFEEEEYFIPELLMCSDAMYAGLDVLRPHLRADEAGKKGRVVIGVVEGDTHDIGKNLVKIMLETAGFEVTDLGRDIPPAQFVETAKAQQADIIALSTLMTTTMDGMAEVIRILQREELRGQFKVIVGGGPISQAFADRIGADGYAVNAAEAAKLATRLVAAHAVSV
jgi:corrinoid protein of di/trimethylamine methyltransferase